MSTWRAISSCAAAALLLASCAEIQSAIAGKRASSAPKKPESYAWIPPAVLEYMPPVVDTLGYNPLLMPDKNSPQYTNPFPKGTYEHFAASKNYPVTSEVYADERLLQQITAANSKIIVCLPQQRARLYVYGRVAMDWPVSTGLKGHDTPTGAFRVMEKSREHHSSRYGKWVVDGKVVDADADLTKSAPEGATFHGSDMPNWHRLTWDGVGIHGGRVVPGRKLSHGCIRTPFATARKLFTHTLTSMPVYISSAVEDYNKGGRLRPEDVKYYPDGNPSAAKPAKPRA